MDTFGQLEQIRKAIQSNVATIRTLLDQADGLHSIALGIQDQATKEQLKSNVNELYATIDTLIKQTDALFDQFANFASSVQKK